MKLTTLSAARAHAAAEYPRESCGYVIIERGQEVYVPVRNMATTRSEHVVTARDAFAGAEDRGEVVAFVHSHPDAPATPSQADKVACEGSGLVWHVISWPADDVRTIVPCGYEAPLVGREFSHGVLDCWSLVRDWFARERHVQLPDFERVDGWWDADDGGSLYIDHYEECGAVSVGGIADLQIGDVIVMEIASKKKRPNHAAVYIGNGQILHHLYNKLSSRDLYDGALQERTRLILRYAP